MSAVVFAPRSTARLEPRGLLAAEFIKLRSLRSIRVGLAAVVVLAAAGSLLRAVVYAGAQGPVGTSIDTWRHVVGTGYDFAGLGALAFAALAGGTEYSTRSIMTTFVAAPRRLAVLAAKAVAAPAAVAVAGAVGGLLGIVVAEPSMRAAHLAPPTSDLVGFCLAGVGQLVLITAVLLGVAVLTRSTAAALTVGFVVLFVLTIPSVYVSGYLHLDLYDLMLPNVVVQVTSLLHAPGLTATFWHALPAAALWVTVPWAAAAIATVRRDV